MSLEKTIIDKKTNKYESKKLQRYDLFLLKYSKIVDSVDMFLGPISEVAKQSEADILKTAGIASSIIKGVIKIPFVALYLHRTQDYTALYDWVPKEVFSYTVPMGSFIDILRSYEKITYIHYGLKPFKKIPKERT